MNQSNRDFNRLRKFVAERLDTTSTIIPPLLIMTCLAVLAIFSNISCSSPPTPPPVTPIASPSTSVTPVTLPPSPMPTSTATQTLTPTLHPPVTLDAPEEDARMNCGTPVTLRWSWPHVLEADECYRLRLWGAEQIPDLFSLTTTDDQFDLSTSDYPPGVYNWAVVVVNSITHEPVSKESKSLHFHIMPPPPIVHSISPAVTVKGVSVIVVISGENFTHPFTLTIGVPLSVTVVDSTMITAIVPTTLGVGEYSVVVQDSYGRVDSSVSFTVKPPPPTIVLTPPPPCTPTLARISMIERNVIFRWECSVELAEDEWFAIRVGKCPDIPHSQHWLKEHEYTYSMCTLGGDPGDYVWEVAVCRGDPSQGRCDRLLSVSERGVFSFGGWPCD